MDRRRTPATAVQSDRGQLINSVSITNSIFFSCYPPSRVAKRPFVRTAEPDAGGNYFGLIRADPGWPGTLKRLPVSVTFVPLTRRIEKS